MAKKTKTEAIGEMIGLVLLIVGVVLMACVALLPLVLLIGSIYYSSRFWKLKRRLKNRRSDFWLSDEELT